LELAALLPVVKEMETAMQTSLEWATEVAVEESMLQVLAWLTRICSFNKCYLNKQLQQMVVGHSGSSTETCQAPLNK
jgi:hypothetical protein